MLLNTLRYIKKIQESKKNQNQVSRLVFDNKQLRKILYFLELNLTGLGCVR